MKEKISMVSHNDNRKYDEVINSLKHKENVRILFVCLGNICRSPAAEAVMQQMVDDQGWHRRFTLDSAGIGGWHIGQRADKRMRVHALRRDIDITHLARQVREADFDRFDLIIGMDSSNIDDLRRLAPTLEAAAKIVPMGRWLDPAMGYDHVPDPYYEGAEGFERVLDLLQVGCRRLLDSLAD